MRFAIAECFGISVILFGLGIVAAISSRNFDAFVGMFSSGCFLTAALWVKDKPDKWWKHE